MSLFEPINLGGVTIPNRIVKSAMVEGRADGRGHATDELVALYERWARGGVGLSITGLVGVLEGWSVTPHELGLYDDSAVEPFRRVTEAVHRRGGRLFVQLCHAPPQILRSKARRLGSLAPSAGFNPATLRFNRALREPEIRRIVQAFGAAARRAREAGADGVQLHAAHGYLISRFLSPLHNRRDDAWGGDTDRRLAFLRAIYQAVREQAGADFPVIVKLNAHDGVRHGLGVEESVRMAEHMQAWGIAGVEVSAGTADVGLSFYPNKGEIPLDLGQAFLVRELPWTRPLLPLIRPVLARAGRSVALREEGYFGAEARRFARTLGIPVIQVGGIRSRETAERIVGEGPVAMVAMARPLVRSPSLPEAWRTGQRAVASCKSCNRCYVRLVLGEPLGCDQRGEA